MKIVQDGGFKDIWYCKCGRCGCLFEASSNEGRFITSGKEFVVSCPMELFPTYEKCDTTVIIHEKDRAKPDWWPEEES